MMCLALSRPRPARPPKRAAYDSGIAPPPPAHQAAGERFPRVGAHFAHTERCYAGARIHRHRARPAVEADLTEQNAVPLIVLSSAREPVEAVNSILRRAGQPVHCTWIPALRDLADALTQLNPEMLVHVAESRAEFEAAIRVRDRKSTRLNSSHGYISYAVFCLKKKKPHQSLGLSIYTRICSYDVLDYDVRPYNTLFITFHTRYSTLFNFLTCRIHPHIVSTSI